MMFVHRSCSVSLVEVVLEEVCAWYGGRDRAGRMYVRIVKHGGHGNPASCIVCNSGTDLKSVQDAPSLHDKQDEHMP